MQLLISFRLCVRAADTDVQIEFRNCTFAYPSRPDSIILRNFSLLIEPGQTVALVGQSGSGKSTIIGLLERFYDLLEGEVLVDDVPVKDWNLSILRDQIGLVQQVVHVLWPRLCHTRSAPMRAKPYD